MGKARTALRFLAVAMIVNVALGAVVIYGASEYKLARTYEPHSPKFVSGSGDADKGERLTRVLGCTDCHGAGLTGKLMFRKTGVGTLNAPNLTRLLVASYSDDSFVGAMREGIRSDGTALLIMPSSRLRFLRDDEIRDILAYLRNLPPRGTVRPRLDLQPLGHLAIALGELRSEPETIAEDEKIRAPKIEGADAGRRLAEITCAECHGPSLKGGRSQKAPDLNVAGAYSLKDFATLLRTGVAAGGRELPQMSEVARVRYASFTDTEITELYRYLVLRAQGEGVR
jgi:cytochrome c553